MKSALLRILYRCGAMGGFHAWRNRCTLTIVLFHRVLPFDTALPRRCWPGWTVTPRFFEECIRFFERHYTIVGIDDVFASLSGGRALPPCALLITFDDGWRDTGEVAAPILRRLGVPCVLFAVGCLDSGAELWQEPIVRAWLKDHDRGGRWQALWRAVLPGEPAPSELSFTGLQRLLAALDDLPADRRESLIEPLEAEQPDPRAMMDGGALRDFARPPFRIGAHGMSHLPLTLVQDPQSELSESRRRIEAVLPVQERGPMAMSWPHGQYSAELAAAAFDAGFRCLFTSDAVLNRTCHGAPSSVLGRFEPGMEYCAGAHGNLKPEVLASLLFRLPRRRLEGRS